MLRISQCINWVKFGPHLHFVARFRTSHSRNKRQIVLSGTRLVLLIGIMALLTYLFQKIILQHFSIQSEMTSDQSEVFYLPGSVADTIIHNRYFSSGISTEYDQPLWVAYELSQAHLKGSMTRGTFQINRGRESRFTESGHIEGQFIPIADRSFSKEAAKETLLPNNITPQLVAFNKGIWRELEEQIRMWVGHSKRLIIISGPVFDDQQREEPDSNQIRIPAGFFKVILDIDNTPPQAIGFVLPHESQEKKLIEFVISVDHVEEKTGIDFFPDLFTDTLEEQIEQEVNTAHWPFDLRLYEMRINKWNKLVKDE